MLEKMDIGNYEIIVSITSAIYLMDR